MMQAVAVTDLHGNLRLYELLLRVVRVWRISSVFITGDLAPSALHGGVTMEQPDDEGVSVQRAFFEREFFPLLESFLLAHRQSDIYVIMGNDDRRANESLLIEFEHHVPGFHLVDDRLITLRDARQKRAFFPGEVPLLCVAGYPYVPPGGTLLMDWVKYENSVKLCPEGMDPCADLYDVGITTASTGNRSTIAEDLADFGSHLRRNARSDAEIRYEPGTTIHLFHAPPYNTPLDWTTPRGRYDYVKLSDHVGSTEIRRFILERQPYLVLCGHCHEAVVIGDYRVDLGKTRCVNPGSQTHLNVLSLVQFDLYNPQQMKQFFIHADEI
ncbi:MAG TPA: metallophosphoesterase [Candidatus Heimdallarchaeota archaeon]|nr:metallophosphoesterase [Candidatus Heimdallarchaeota archaeon]